VAALPGIYQGSVELAGKHETIATCVLLSLLPRETPPNLSRCTLILRLAQPFTPDMARPPRIIEKRDKNREAFDRLLETLS
jgi:hypothetical protein